MKTWGRAQINGFAKDMARGDAGRLWWFVGAEIRSALVDAKVLEIVCGQDDDRITVAEIHKLRVALVARLAAKPWGMHIWDLGESAEVEEARKRAEAAAEVQVAAPVDVGVLVAGVFDKTPGPEVPKIVDLDEETQAAYDAAIKSNCLPY